MDKIKVSILVPAYNVEAYIDECLQSLLSQTLKEIEIVVVDDGSTDQTATIAERYAATDSRIRVIRLPEHQGVSYARNVCLAQAQGEYLSFVDSDDTITSTAMEELYHKAVSTDAEIVLGSMLFCYPDKKQVRIGDKSSVFHSNNEIITGQECFIRMQQKGCYVPMVCGNLYRTAFIKAHPQLHFEGDFHEDEYFTPFALYEATRVTDFKKDFYYYRQRTGSIMHNPKNIKLRAEALYTIAESQEKGIIPEKIYKKYFDQHLDRLFKRAQELYETYLQTSEKKCLFIFSEESNAARYGIGTYVQQLVKCFNPMEWDVQTVSLYSTSQEKFFQLKSGIAWYYFPMTYEKSVKHEPKYEKKYHKSIFFYLASRIDDKRKIFCHFNYSYHNLLAILFKQELKASIVFTVHYTHWSFELLGDKDKLKKLLEETDNITKRTFEEEKDFMTNHCDCIIAIAQHSYDMLSELYEIQSSKLVKIPNALEDCFQEQKYQNRKYIRTKYKYDKDEKLIVFAGRLKEIKGIMQLIVAFKEIQEQIPNARLIIAGSGDFTQCMEKAFPFSKHIDFIGYLSKEQLYELYQIADVGVVPSIYEEFGYVAIEMMQNKLPIVVHNTTGLSEITAYGKYGETFMFNTEKDTKPLKEAIVKILTEKPTEQQLDERRDWVLNNYSIPLFRQRILSTYACMENPYKF